MQDFLFIFCLTVNNRNVVLLREMYTKRYQTQINLLKKSLFFAKHIKVFEAKIKQNNLEMQH